MPRIDGVLQICGGAGAKSGVWVEILDAQGKCFVLGHPGDVVDLIVVKNVQRAVCPHCEGARIIFFTPAGSLVPIRADPCSRCKGRGFIAVTELTPHELPSAVLTGTKTVSRGESRSESPDDKGLLLKHFVLSPTKDGAYGEASRTGARAYAEAIQPTNPILAAELLEWLRTIEEER